MRPEAITRQYNLCKRKPSPETVRTISVLHVALEYGQATLGGLGVVATQMVNAQNIFVGENQSKINACVITPYYPKLYSSYKSLQVVAEVEHLFDNRLVKSLVYLVQQGFNRHYMIAPKECLGLFDSVASVNYIYNDNTESIFLDRIKYFASAVAAYAHQNSLGIQHPAPQLLILHDWHTALVPKVLSDVHVNGDIKYVFVVHVSNVDYGGFESTQLQGIGLKLPEQSYLLKALGIESADKIVTVSKSFLKECIETTSEDPAIDLLRKLFVIASSCQGKVTSILNGIDYQKFNLVRSLMPKASSVYEAKASFKRQLAWNLSSWTSSWNLNPDLPMILFIGRISREKRTDTFRQLINLIKDKAIFIALGRGMSEDLLDIIKQHSRKTNNIFISCDEEDQLRHGALIRAATDFSYFPSDRETCNVASIENLVNGAPCISTAVGGMEDFLKKFDSTDKYRTTGNAFIFKRQAADSGDNPDLEKVVNEALSLWSTLTPLQKNSVQERIMSEAQCFDWLAPNGPLSKYSQVFEELLDKPVKIKKTEKHKKRVKLNPSSTS